MIEGIGLHVAYGPVVALSDVSCILHPGEVVGVLGPNGAGKSSLVNALAGLVSPTSGAVMLDGTDLTHKPAFKRVREGVSLVMERRHLFGKMTVEENLLLGAHVHRKTKDARTALTRVLEVLPELGTNLGRRAEILSGGQQQMVAIGRGLMAEPKVLLADEPFLGLAPRVAETIAQTLRALAADGLGVMFIEQSVETISRTSDRIYLLEHGVPRFVGTPTELLSSGVVEEVYFGQRTISTQMQSVRGSEVEKT